jgi:hypothetical protein
VATGRALAQGMKLDRVVVDTSVVSYILKNNPLAPWYSDLLRGRLVGLFFMALAELYRTTPRHFQNITDLEVLTAPV